MTKHQELFHQLFQTSRIFAKNLNEKLSDLGIYSSQWTIIYCLKRSGPATQAELCQYLNVEAPTMTRTITRLVNAGWVSKTTGRNNREKRIELTEAAHSTYPLWEKTVSEFEETALNGITDADIKTLNTHFQQILGNMNIQE
ncbi:MarR family winged helix-turn-helix transcriptional regulator [Lederbergia lenta]|uniref:MarR family transcriptional regulator n=1 Tax=Lederbergia lenta TaxID=1467 RepID=A0A2X4YRD6_LEDLE|nr:MarR family transcriptional regulator [Lederbergia lenta]MCM3111026.1 MarR family transcriptional regulator [Lederbergia lenta]MEC2325586.1 MarR family transcriptional regulator [Lederbergia lenta]SQI54205.1 MarR family transcriptional regulator [Lederbergia lenta]